MCLGIVVDFIHGGFVENMRTDVNVAITQRFGRMGWGCNSGVFGAARFTRELREDVQPTLASCVSHKHS